MKFIHVHTQVPPQAYLPPREFTFVRLETAVAFIPAGVGSVVIVSLIAFIAPVLVIEEDMGLGDDEEVARLVLFVVEIVVKVQNLRINRL